MKVTDLKKKSVCIVTFDHPQKDMPMPGRFFQVTVDPGKYSPAGDYIRFGANDGDELLGWQPVAWIVVTEVLGEWGEDGSKPELYYKAGVTVVG